MKRQPPISKSNYTPFPSTTLFRSMLQKSLEAKGLKFLLQKDTEQLLDKRGRVSAVRFKNGEDIPADIVVMAVGIRPNYALAESAGIYCNRGIVDRKSTRLNSSH